MAVPVAVRLATVGLSIVQKLCVALPVGAAGLFTVTATANRKGGFAGADRLACIICSGCKGRCPHQGCSAGCGAVPFDGSAGCGKIGYRRVIDCTEALCCTSGRGSRIIYRDSHSKTQGRIRRCRPSGLHNRCLLQGPLSPPGQFRRLRRCTT